MTDEERNRLLEFLEKKLCGPCRREGAAVDHPACKEAEDLMTIVRSSGSQADAWDPAVPRGALREPF